MNFDWRRLITPSAWLQNYPTGWVWDRRLNELLDEHGVTDIRDHTVKVGNVTVWVSNWPYGYGDPYQPAKGHFLPSYSTRLRLRREIEKAISS